MALTATATSASYSAVCTCSRLAMDKSTVIGLPPYRDSIKYIYVVHPKVQVDEFTTRLCEELVTK